MSKPYQDEETLRELYVEKEMSIRAVAKKLDCSNVTVLRYLRKFGIETRDRGCHGSSLPTFYTSKRGYESWTITNETVSELRVHRLLAIANGASPYEVFGDKHVHHKNRVPWDNRPENVELLGVSEHCTIHAKHAAEKNWGYDFDE